MQYIYQSPIGKLIIEDNNNKLYKITFGNDSIENNNNKPNQIIKKTIKQLTEYFDGKRKSFDIEIDISEGSDFQQQVWLRLLEIPYGETTTYSEIAKLINRPTASRAVGMANHHNPIPIIIPCHRVIGKNGSLTGYAGQPWRKKYLLDLEQRTKLFEILNK